MTKHTLTLVLLLFMALSSVAVFAQTGGALNFDGIDDRVSGTNISLPQANSPRTIEAWVRYTANDRSVFSYGTESTNQLFSLHIYNGVYIVGLNNDFSTNSGYNPNVWHHIAVTHDGTTTTVYVDGVSAGTKNTTYNTTGTIFQFGAILRSGGNYTNLYSGDIDEVRVWNVARTQAEIQANMNLELSSGTGLIAAYHFNQGVAGGDNSGITTLIDDPGASDGILNNFALTGSTSNWVSSGASVSPPAGEALNFDGTNDYVLGTLPDAPQGTSARTVECWVKTTSSATSQTLVNYGTLVNNQRFALLLASGKIYISPHNNDFDTGILANDGTWHHIAVTFDGTTLRVYKDGVLVGSQAKTFATTGTNLEIGTNWRGSLYGEFLNGSLDEVRIWNVARTQAEIQTDMFVELSSGTGLIAAYHFNQGVAAGSNAGVTTLTDALGASNGTLSNFALTGSTSNWVGSGFPLSKVWTGSASSDWSSASNWSTGFVPSATDNVTLPATGVTNEAVIASAVTAASISMGAGRSITLNPGGSLAINSNLFMNGGNITLNDQNLTFGSSATVPDAAATRCIVTNGAGNVSRELAASESFQFPIAPTATTYNPVTVTLDSGDPTETFSASVKGSFDVAPNDANLVLTRQWTITEGTPGGNNATLAFQYAASDPRGALFQPSGPTKFVGRYTGSQWVATAGTITGSDPYTVTASGFTAFSPFGISETSSSLPVQLASFTGTYANNSVRLNWRTISEINNYGFYVQRKLQGESNWTELPNSFIAGHGTTNEPHDYSFADNVAPAQSSDYRLKQVDLDGTIHFSEPITVSVTTGVAEVAPREFSLKQNYPNPFNPETTIKFSVERTDRATVELFNLLGQKVATLFDDVAEVGKFYQVRLDGSHLSSGVYLYRMQSGQKSDMKKLVLLK